MGRDNHIETAMKGVLKNPLLTDKNLNFRTKNQADSEHEAPNNG